MFKVLIFFLLLYCSRINSDEKVQLRPRDKCESNCVTKCCSGIFYEPNNKCTDASGNNDLLDVKQPVYFYRDRMDEVFLTENFSLLYGMVCAGHYKLNNRFNLQWHFKQIIYMTPKIQDPLMHLKTTLRPPSLCTPLWLGTHERKYRTMNKETAFEYVTDGFPDDVVRFKGAILRGDPRVYADDIDNFEVREDDVWLAGVSRSGTHWASEMIWRVARDPNLENTDLQEDRFPLFDALIEPNLSEPDKTYDEVMSMLKSKPSPRFLRTHAPLHLLPRQLRNGDKKAKLVYITRNPKDVCVSFYYFFKHFHNFKGNLEEMCDLFISDKVNFTPYWGNVLGFWEKRNDLNILFLKYEDMKKDLPSVIRKTGEFFGKNLTNEQVSALTAHLSFENYSENPTLSYRDVDAMYNARFGHDGSKGFVRKGTAGQWKEEMSADTARRLDQWVEDNLQNTDYQI